MFVKSQSEDRYINLDRVDSIEINVYNSVVCKIDNKGYVLGLYNSKEEAQRVINKLVFKNCISVED